MKKGGRKRQAPDEPETPRSSGTGVAPVSSGPDPAPDPPNQAVATPERPVRGVEPEPPVEAAQPEGIESTAGGEVNGEGPAEREYLAFRLCSEEYAVDIMKIKEIIRPVTMTFVPRAPSYIRGIISLRGVILPILDLEKRLGLEKKSDSENPKIVVVAFVKGLAGFFVDRITEVVRLRTDSIEPPPPTLHGSSAMFIRGVGRYKGRMLALLDVEEIVRSDV